MKWRGTRQENGDLILTFDVEGETVEKRVNRIHIDQDLFNTVKKVLSNAIEQHFTKFRDRPSYYIDLPSLKRHFNEFTKNPPSAATIQDLIISIDHAFSIEADCLGSKDCKICKQVWTIRDKLAQKLRKALNIPNDVPVAHL